MQEVNRDKAQVLTDTVQSYGRLVLKSCVVLGEELGQGHACCLGLHATSVTVLQNKTLNTLHFFPLVLIAKALCISFS